MKGRRLAAVSAAAVMGFFISIGIVSAYVVSPSSPNGWSHAQENSGGSTLSYVVGPVTPPSGAGSARMTLNGNTSGGILVTSQFQGTKFADITRLEYSTYQASRVGTAVALALQFTADNDLTDADTGFKGRLVYEPYRTETVKDDEWQTWNPMNGKWFGTGTPGPARPFAQLCPQNAPCTWQQVLTFFPNGGIHTLDPNAVLFKGGSNWGALFDGNVDAFTIGINGANTTVDFEPNGANVLVVSPANQQGWVIQTSGTSTAGFVNGPAAPPLGTGSGELSVGSNGGGAAQFRHGGYAGTPLGSLTGLSYSTYTSNDGTAPANGDQTVYIILNVDYNGDGATDDLLFFEPEYQHGYTSAVPDQGDNTLNTWQRWDALHGGWWSVNNTGGAGPGTNVKPLSAIIAAQPGARLANGNSVRIVTGFGAGAWDNYVGSVDAFTIGVGVNVTTYNFEADADGDGAFDGNDCAPFDPNIHPGATETCNGVDDNCDGNIDEGVTTTFYPDGDGDGYGDSSQGVQACGAPPGHVATGGDCNDNNAAVNPGATEVCNGMDDDCDGSVDEGFLNTDGDTLADCVDPDDDHDGVLDGADNCPLVANPNQADFDGDGIGDACEVGPVRPTNKDQCKNNGWMTWAPRFKNQGDCIQYVNTGK